MKFSRVSAVGLACCLLATTFAVELPAHAQSNSQIKNIEKRIEVKKDEIKQIDKQANVTKQDLASIQAELTKAQDELNARTKELEVAQAALDNKERQLAATGAELANTEHDLLAAKQEMAAQGGVVNERLRLAYIQAQPSSMPALKVQDVQEFAQASHYLQSILTSDRAAIEHMEILRIQIEADETRLVTLKQRQEEQKKAAQTERDRVTALVAQQKVLVGQVQSKVDKKNAILRELAKNKSSAQAVVKELEAESNRIAAQLRAIARQQAAAAAAAAAGKPTNTTVVKPSRGGMILPVHGRFSSPFGYRTHPISGVRKLHTGQDIAVGSGTPIKAAKAGRVVTASWYGGYGLCVVIDHGGGLATLYAHQSRLGVSRGQMVSQGQTIGYVGTTGYSTGPHLHFEVRRNGTPVNPMSYV